MSTFPIVIIGAGPAGIATAVEAINRGFKSSEIIILERSGQIAHMISSKYPSEKAVLANYKGQMARCIGDMCITDMSKKEFFDYLHSVVKQYSLKIDFHNQVKKIVKLKNGQFNVETNLDTYTSTSVFVAIGSMAAPRSLGVPVHTDVIQKIHYDIQNISTEDKHILVVGGGDSAAEYSKILIERGHRVSLSYRGQDFSRMIEANALATRSLIEKNKMSFLRQSEIEKIDSKGSLPHIIFKDSRYPEMIVDRVVTALGTERPLNYLNSIGINTETEQGELFLESKMAGLFFVGDLAASKGGSINFAFNSGVKAVEEACYSYLDCAKPAVKKAA